MSFYGNHRFGGPRHPYHPAPQSFNFFTAPNEGPRHPSYPPFHHPSTFGPYEHEYQHDHPPFGHRHRAYQPAQPSPYHHVPDVDLEEEERAALAHLRSIQRRREAEREAEEAVREREREREREAERRREAKRLEEARERERERELRLVQAQREREQAILAAVQQRQSRKEAIQRAVIEHHHHKQQEAARQQAIQAKQAAIQAIITAKQEAIHRAKQEAYQKAVQRRSECAQRCAAKFAQKATRAAAGAAQKEYPSEYEALNGLLGGLFGINLVNEAKETEKEAVAKDDKQAEKPVEKKVTFDAPAATSDAKPAAPAQATTTSAAVDNDKSPRTFPEDLNDLLAQFLGLRIEPTSATSSPAGTHFNEVPKGLNEFLSRFGLVFEPLDVAEEVKEKAKEEETKKEATATTTAPAATTAVADPPVEPLPTTIPPAARSVPTSATPTTAASSSSSAAKSSDEAPLTSFLNSFTDLPPFVRDILGNVELAFKEERAKTQEEQAEEEVKGKGKGVAKGEKSDRPIPAPQPTPASAPIAEANPTDPLATLSNISSELDLVLDSFTFPTSLSFGPSTDTAAPALLFNKANHQYHAQAHKLLQLLLAADSVASGGLKEVRQKRKTVVARVERELEALEKRRDAVWEDVRARRERGEEVEVIEEERSAGSSETGSSVDAAEGHTAETFEHVEHIEHAHAGDEAVNKEEKSEGYDVPAQLHGEGNDIIAATPAEDDVATPDNSDITTIPTAAVIDPSGATPAHDSTDVAEPQGETNLETPSTTQKREDKEQQASIQAEAEVAEVKNAKDEEGYELL